MGRGWRSIRFELLKPAQVQAAFKAEFVPANNLTATQQLPAAFSRAWRRCGILPTRDVLVVEVASQILKLFDRAPAQSVSGRFPAYQLLKHFRISTSRFGTGQEANSYQTPLGLHRIAEKIGGGRPVGTVFRSRQAVGLTWQGMPDAAIAHRILWLEGLEPGFNRGGNVDSHARYIYIHGVGDETTLGRPASRGCIHLAAKDLLSLFDRVPAGTLVWIGV